MAMTFMAPVPWEADAFYAQPGMADGQPDARHLAGGHRPVHADRVLPGSPPGDGAQSELPRRAVSVRRRARRQGGRPARRLRQEDAVRRQDRRHRRAREGAAASAKFLQGYYDLEVFERTDLGMEYIVDASRTPRKSARSTTPRASASTASTTSAATPRLQHARSGGRQGRHAAAAGEATASCARRSRSRSTGRRLRPRSSRRRPAATAQGPLPGGIFGSREGTPEGVDPITHRRGRRQARAPLDRRGEAADGRGRLPRRPRRAHRPAAGAQLRLLARCPRRSARSRSTGWCGSSPSSTSSSRCAPPTTTSSRTRCARASTRSSGAGWNADYPDAENFLFLFYGPNAKSDVRGREQRQLPEPRVRQALSRRCRPLDDGPAQAGS